MTFLSHWRFPFSKHEKSEQWGLQTLDGYIVSRICTQRTVSSLILCTTLPRLGLELLTSDMHWFQSRNSLIICFYAIQHSLTKTEPIHTFHESSSITIPFLLSSSLESVHGSSSAQPCPPRWQPCFSHQWEQGKTVRPPCPLERRNIAHLSHYCSPQLQLAPWRNDKNAIAATTGKKTKKRPTISLQLLEYHLAV